MKIVGLLFLLFLTPFVLALTVGDATTPGRVENENLVSDRDEDPEVPVFGNVQNDGAGNVTVVWTEVTTDTQGNPVTIHMYELRYREVGTTVYTLITIPPAFVGHSLTETTGSYEGYVEAVGDDGFIATAGTFTFEVN